MRLNLRLGRGLRLAAIACVVARAAAAQVTGAAPASIAIVGSDYAFIQFPATIAAGPTRFSFENRGTVRHEMSMVLLKAGVTVDSVLKRGPGGAGSRAMAEKLIGILIARPAESAGGELLVRLEAGQRYLVVCTLKDAPDAQPHTTMGMVASFTVIP